LHAHLPRESDPAIRETIEKRLAAEPLAMRPGRNGHRISETAGETCPKRAGEP